MRMRRMLPKRSVSWIACSWMAGRSVSDVLHRGPCPRDAGLGLFPTVRVPGSDAACACAPPLAAREVRGIGFIEYADPLDAQDAQRGLDRMWLNNREVRPASSN